MDPSKNPTGGGGGSRRTVDHDEFDTQEDMADMIAQVMDHEDVESVEKFDRTLLDNSEAMLDSRRFDERDYQSHRRESFPHAHNPLRSNRSSHRRKSVKASTSSDVGSPNILPMSKVTPIHVPNPDTYHNRALCASEENFEIEPLLNLNDNDNEPESLETPSEVLAHPECTFFDDFSTSPVKKVQFEVGGTPVPSNESLPVPEKKKHRRHHHHHHHHHHYSKMQEDMSPDVLMDVDQPIRYNPLMPESLDLGPEVPMADLDKDDLTTHRFADNKSFRRHKFQRNVVQDEQSPFKQPVKYDHQPHEIFVELDVLSGHGEHRQWKEAARWIKYEEDVEEGVDRWGRPHVASLSFHSLINLRRLIESGVTLLDLEERDLPGVAYRSVEAMVVHELIRPEDRAQVMRALLLKHKHVAENDGWRFIRRNTHSGSLTSLQAILDHDKGRKGSHNLGMTSPNTAPENLGKMSRRNSINTPKLLQNQNEYRGMANGNNPDLVANQDESGHTAVDMSKLSLSNLSEEDVKWVLNKESSLLRRIPVGAEASIVLVGKDETLKRPIMAFIRLAESSYMPNITELPIPVRFMYILLGPSSYDLDYKEIGRSISTLMSNKHFHEIAYRAHDKKDMLKGIHEFLDESIVLPPGDWDNELFPFEEMKEKSQALRKRKEKRDKKASLSNNMKALPPSSPPPDGDEDPFRRTKKLFGGMMQDIKKRYPRYFSDLKDGFHFQILASILFIYFACVSGAIAFGGILGEKTGRQIGISETLITTAIGGVVFSLFAGQPLVIIGTTGPLLMFDESLYSVCEKINLKDNFLAFRFFIGLWLVLIATFFCAFDGSAIARYFSRFIQEIFAAMISILFVYDAINSLVKIYIDHPLQFHYPAPAIDPKNGESEHPMPNTALLSTVMCLGTFGVAYLFRQIRTSRYFNPMIRDLLGNFAVPIAIIAMVGLDLILSKAAATQKLKVPEGLQTTKQRSSWLVDLSSLPVHFYFIAAVPAMLVFILIFMEMSICSLIIAKKENKLKKGTGFFVDIFLVCVINGCLMTIGGCWVGAATVRAVAHASSLVIFSTNNPPGEKPTILGVREQRVSNFIISILVGLSVLMSPALKLIPMSVLFGVFLYMGISSMAGIQFFERISLIFTQVSNYPQVPYVRRIRTKKLHLFTVIQFCCLGILFGVKFTPAALAIPFLLVLLVPLRFLLLPFIFSKVELGCLDAKGLEPDESPSSEEHLEIPVISVTDIKAVKLGLPETATEETNIIPPDGEESAKVQGSSSNGKVEMNGTVTSTTSVPEDTNSKLW